LKKGQEITVILICGWKVYESSKQEPSWNIESLMTAIFGFFWQLINVQNIFFYFLFCYKTGFNHHHCTFSFVCTFMNLSPFSISVINHPFVDKSVLCSNKYLIYLTFISVLLETSMRFFLHVINFNAEWWRSKAQAGLSD
jgi:hypothetical protein